MALLPQTGKPASGIQKNSGGTAQDHASLNEPAYLITHIKHIGSAYETSNSGQVSDV
jgi:hypothetical protein